SFLTHPVEDGEVFFLRTSAVFLLFDLIKFYTIISLYNIDIV
ncbi:MAG: hypothetical protein PWQ60_822, partial [Thermoanaerobacteraceae bacterium]|nr:hypothetical protein [Thermoanaerobacteraceae bacterium]